MSDYLSNLAARTYQHLPVLQPRLASHFETVPTPGILGARQPAEPVLPAALDDATAIDSAAAALPALPSRAAMSAITPVPKVAEAPQNMAASPLVSPTTPLTEPQAQPTRAKRVTPVHDSEEPAHSMQPAPRRPARQPAAQEESNVPQATPAILSPVEHTSRPEPQRAADAHHSARATTLTRIEAVHTIERIIERHNRVPTGATIADATANFQARSATRHDAQALPMPKPPLPGIVAQPMVSVAPSASPPAAEPHFRVETSAPPPTIQVTIGRVEVRATPAPAAAKPTAVPNKTLSLEEYLRRRNEGGQR